MAVPRIMFPEKKCKKTLICLIRYAVLTVLVCSAYSLYMQTWPFYQEKEIISKEANTPPKSTLSPSSAIKSTTTPSTKSSVSNDASFTKTTAKESGVDTDVNLPSDVEVLFEKFKEVRDYQSALIIVAPENYHGTPELQLSASLHFLRVKHDIRLSNWSFVDLNNDALYDVILFLHLNSYSKMPLESQTIIKSYCKNNDVGMVIFQWQMGVSADRSDLVPVNQVPLKNVTKYRIDAVNPIWRTTKDGGDVTFAVQDPKYLWVAFDLSGHSEDYVPIGFAEQSNDESTRHVAGYLDHGAKDGIEKLVLGNSLSFWLHHSILIDALHFLTDGKISLPLKRPIIIDIDDGFLGKKENKMNESDVEALIDLNKRLANYIRNFKFNVAFSGTEYKQGTDSMIKGDELLTAHKDDFTWFPHNHDHQPAHLVLNLSTLEDQMKRNKEFAERLGLPVMKHYSVPPQHSGIYPVVDRLYIAWKKIWDIRVTATMMFDKEYTVNRLHKGFEHAGIQVLPRDTLEIASTMRYWSDVRGGREGAERSIHGGKIYLRLLYTAVQVIMTHSYNYAKERPANTVLERSFQFMKNWTNLDFVEEPPLETAQQYFDKYPAEKLMQWQDPCRFVLKRIYQNDSKCVGYKNPFLPDFVVLGPQRTGSTALHRFLSMHPYIMPNRALPETAEEIQYFTDEKRYSFPPDWYMEQFPNRTSPGRLLFEKSATYFSHERAPIRLYAMLPEAKLIVILDDPVRRAYSHYQHLRADGDPVASSHSFYDVISADGGASDEILKLREDCLKPGLYEMHILRWQRFYDIKQMMFVDGKQLRNNATKVIGDIQTFLGLRNIDYSSMIKFNTEKGVFCTVDKSIGDSPKCLSTEQQTPMSPKEQLFLKKFYKTPNLELYTILHDRRIPIPSWLETTLKST